MHQDGSHRCLNSYRKSWRREGEIRVEAGIPYETIRALMFKGHNVGFQTFAFGAYQGILWDKENKVYRDASENRKDGQAAAY